MVSGPGQRAAAGQGGSLVSAGASDPWAARGAVKATFRRPPARYRRGTGCGADSWLLQGRRGWARTMPHIPPPLPWKQFSEPDADAEYLVLLTFCR